ncbi:hypothetical protein WR25_17981 [Diploscapter pachys]|uniref:Uncharacterized protein n=1 Tax=Diploscapter pachys TaxID=2018661 RepID=A0A2A2LT51_9BILA|nr:hypothetical protein WR25_17981 [Diploscapter pachys]
MRDERRDSGVVIDEDSDEDTYTPVKKRVRKSAIQSDSSRESTPDRDANSASKSNYRRIVVSSDEDETPRKKRKQHDAFSSDSSQVDFITV